MANEITIVIKGDAKGAKQAFDATEKAAKDAARETERAQKEAARAIAAEYRRMEREADARFRAVANAAKAGGLAVAAGITAGIVAGGRAAIAYESAFAGVRKTVDGTDEELAAISREFLNMSRTIPVSAVELAKIGEEAGALGVAKENVVSFSRTMADLGVTTDLTSTQAAESFARFANIMQTPQSEFQRLGSTVVDLGNNLAATEQDIISMGLRIAGAGKQVGLTESQVLGFAGALSSVGIEAEAGGTAFSTVMVKMAEAVHSNSDELKLFAAVAGVSVEEFKQRFQTDATGAILAFVGGLGKASKAGANVFGVLDELELGEIRVRDALLRASNAGDLFSRAIQTGSDAWKTNTALTKEAEERYKTTESQLQILGNRLNVIANDAGEKAGPGFNRLAKEAGNLAEESKPAVEWVGTRLGEAFDSAANLAGIATIALREFKKDGLDGVGAVAEAGIPGINNFANAVLNTIPPLKMAADALTLWKGLQGDAPVGMTRVPTRDEAMEFKAGVDQINRPIYGPEFTPEIAAAIEKERAIAKAAAATNEELARQKKFFDDLVASLRKGGGAAASTKTEMQALGVSAGALREAMDLLGFSSAQQRAVLMALGVEASEAGEVLEGLNLTVDQLAAAFDRAGLNGKALVAQVQEAIAAKRAEAEAERMAAEARRLDAESASRLEGVLKAGNFTLEEQRRILGALGVDLIDLGEELGDTGITAERFAEDLKRAGLSADEVAAAVAKARAELGKLKEQEKVAAGISGVAARDFLGRVRGRGTESSTEAAADFNKAADGLDELKAAGLSLDVALDIVDRRVQTLAKDFQELSGDDAAAAGVALDKIKRLNEAFARGEISLEQYQNGLKEAGGELDRLAPKVDAARDKIKKFDFDNAAKQARDAAETAQDILDSQFKEFLFKGSAEDFRLNKGLQEGWERAMFGRTAKEFADGAAAAVREANQAAANEMAKQQLKQHYQNIAREQLGQTLAEFVTTGNLRGSLAGLLRQGESAGFTAANLRDVLGKAGIPDVFLPQSFRKRAFAEDFVGVFHDGGTVPRTGMALVQQGETVSTPADMKDVVTALTAILGAIQQNRPVIDRQALSEAVSHDIGQRARVQSLLGAV